MAEAVHLGRMLSRFVMFRNGLLQLNLLNQPITNL